MGLNLHDKVPKPVYTLSICEPVLLAKKPWPQKTWCNTVRRHMFYHIVLASFQSSHTDTVSLVQSTSSFTHENNTHWKIQQLLPPKSTSSLWFTRQKTTRKGRVLFEFWIFDFLWGCQPLFGEKIIDFDKRFSGKNETVDHVEPWGWTWRFWLTLKY